MVAALTRPPKPPIPQAGGPRPPQGIFQTTIQGRYRPVSVHQLAMVWWLYQAKHITARQFRIYFAAHEMHERRRYTKAEPGQPARKPLYTLAEVKALIGSEARDKALTADVNALGRIGLVAIGPHSIEFAVSIDQIAIEDVSGFWSFFEQLPNSRRRVPVPRRTCRSLARGHTRGVSGMMLALMIRSLFWHRPGGRAGEQGGYRIDGRTKCSWIADVFGLDRKTVTNARRELIEKGWLCPIECPQWELNKWGQRYRLNVEAFGPEDAGNSTTQGFNTAASSEGGFPSPSADSADAFPSPCLNTSAPYKKENLKTRKPAPVRSGSTGLGSREENGGAGVGVSRPMLTNIQSGDLRDTGRLLDLLDQAIQAGHPVRGEKGRIEFFALAQRAARQGDQPIRLFVWMLRHRKFNFITQADEDAAVVRLKRHRFAQTERRSEQQQRQRSALRGREAFWASLGEDERFVHACLNVARQNRVDPFRIAQARGWTRSRWEDARMSYEYQEQRRWHSDEVETDFIHVADGQGGREREL